MLEHSVPEGLHSVERTHSGATHEELQPVGRTHFGEVLGGLSLVGGGPHAGAGEESEEEGVAEITLDHTPHSPSSCATQG